ncbi:carbohydrate ABC transporter permease [Halobacterium zhouii]|uniref:carbohydrate ABC transporter permease n=1 Tax=Halobacterium zhouii TaxID=2902624 RepID=UPI001E50EAC6|nr:sugar ABC transporter permease [Halobacterium zhouii]
MSTLDTLRQRLNWGGRDTDPAENDTAATDGGTAVGTPGARERSTLRQYWNSDFVRSMPFWLVPFAVMGLFVYGAIGWNFVISLTDYAGFDDANYSDLDFQNYVEAVTSPQVIAAARNTLVLVVAFTIVCLAVGLTVAVLLDRQVRFESTLRTIYLLPMALSFIVTGQFWLWMYNVNNGIVNAFVGLFGLGPYNWVGNPDLVLAAVVFALVWQFSGYCMVVYLAALRGIPNDQFEAARIDGASTLRMYWRVIVPQLKPATVSATVVLMLFALKAFSFLYALFGGYRPTKGADILATLMVRQAFQLQQWAYASAIAIILFVMTLGIIAPYLYYQYRGDNL